MQRHSTRVQVVDILKSSTSSLDDQVMLPWVHEDADLIEVSWSIVPPGMFVTWTFGADDNLASMKCFFRHLNDLEEVFDIGVDFMDSILDHLEQVSEYCLLSIGGGSWYLHLHVVEPHGALHCSIVDIQLCEPWLFSFSSCSVVYSSLEHNTWVET